VRTLEFIADGTVVDLVELDTVRSTRLPDGTVERRAAQRYQCWMGSFRVVGDQIEYSLTEVAVDSYVVGVWTWRIDGTSLLLDEDGRHEEFVRDEPEVSPPGHLLGLWRRVRAFDDTDLGVRFTPGGLAIIVGRKTNWPGGTSASLSWLCLFTTYRVVNGMLHIVRPNSDNRPSSCPLQLEGDRLTLGKRVYERVRGVVPFRGGDLDRGAWAKLK
jgi:hypothetical protein